MLEMAMANCEGRFGNREKRRWGKCERKKERKEGRASEGGGVRDLSNLFLTQKRKRRGKKRE